MALLTTALRTVILPNGEIIPALGQSTWHMAEDPRRRTDEITAMRLGVDLGMSLIDRAEMYANGDAKVLVGDAIKGRTGFPGQQGPPPSCDGARDHRSLRRQSTETGNQGNRSLSLHWRGPIPLEQTVEAFGRFQGAGKIGSWDVSNFDLSDMQDLMDVRGGGKVSTNQVLYNLEYRGIEYDLLPWCEGSELPIMSSSPVEQGRVLDHPVLRSVAARHRATP